jgi:hypothetical protein
MFKNITKITTVAALTLFTIACDKDEITPINSVNTTTSTADGERLAQQVTQQAYAKLATFTKTDWIDKATPLKAQLEVNGKLYNDKSGTPVALEDIFFLHEGVINSIYTTTGDPEHETELHTVELEVEVYEENGGYLISIADYNQFFAEVVTALTSQVQPSNGDYLSMTDLALIAVNGNTAVIKVTAFVTTPPVSPLVNLTPGGALHGVELDGWCATNSGSIDASVILNSYIQQYAARNNAGSGCSGRMLVNLGTFNSSFPGDAIVHGLSHVSVLNNVWKEITNNCVGDDNNAQNNDAIWNSWYSKSLNLLNSPVSHYNSSATQPNVTAVFMAGAIYGHGPNSLHPNGNLTLPTTNFTHWHEAVLFYGIEIC